MGKFIKCECGSLEHLVYFQSYNEVDWPELIVSIHLANYNNFLRRLWVGLKYAFGYRCKYGDWDEILLWKDKIVELRDFLDEILRRTIIETFD